MLYPFKKAFAGSLAALCLLGSAWGQSTISFTNSATAPLSGTSFANISLGKFNSSLGTLTAVVVQMDYTTASGEITVTLLSGSTTVTGVNTVMTFRQASTNSLGFNASSFTNSLSVDPPLPVTLGVDDPATFALSPSPTNLSLNFSTNIATNFWSAYSSVSGSGVVTFQFRNTAGVQVTATSPEIDRSAFQNIGRMSVTYTYSTGPEPIPEPSTVAAGAFLTLLAAASYWRRRRNSSAAKN